MNVLRDPRSRCRRRNRRDAALAFAESRQPRRRRAHPARQTRQRDHPRALACVHTARRPSCSDAMPPQARKKSPVSMLSSPAGDGEWSETTRSSAPCSNACQSCSRSPRSRIGGAHLNSSRRRESRRRRTSDSADRSRGDRAHRPARAADIHRRATPTTRGRCGRAHRLTRERRLIRSRSRCFGLGGRERATLVRRGALRASSVPRTISSGNSACTMSGTPSAASIGIASRRSSSSTAGTRPRPTAPGST